MIILTSSVASVAEHIYKKYLFDKGYKSVVFIDTAAEPEIAEGDDWLQADLLSLKNQGYKVDRYTITGQTREEIEKKIDEYDVLYMCGGNTAYLLEQLQKTNSLDLIREKVKSGKPYIGTSAGSIIAGPLIPDYLLESTPSLQSQTALDLVNFVVVPHWGSAYFKDEYVGRRLEIAYRTDQRPYLLLSDTQYVYVNEKGLLEINDIHI